MSRRRIPTWLLGVALASSTISRGCGADPCQLLVQETCGSDDACAGDPPCQQARQMSQRGVLEACEAARDNPISFPDCRS